MDKIIYKCQYVTIRVRDAVLFVVLFLLLFFCLKGCQEYHIRKKKEDKIRNTCVFINENIKDINMLLDRADLCSDEWFDDLNDYIVRLKEQNSLLKKQTAAIDKKVYDLQKDILKELQSFDKKQSEESIDALGAAVKEYQAYYDSACGQGEGIHEEDKD